ncbi:hypothetical protein EIB71_00070 [Kaistella daneshvariae]|uniref:Uncharacterized protein n=1 Tax=Kaistella daneshvariae TaxID=2487074 RepID=A0ABM7C5C7_9FLAO|nr:STM3941 family protein [Kaistella daneshvariae]AZI66169.1 hypothetical protein EIB71_00070 [Kaistella daneshvariae]
MNRIEIYSNKKKAFLLLIGSIAFVVLGFFCFLNAENMTTFRVRNPIIIKIVGIASVLLFGFGIYVSIKQLIQKKLMLILDEKGINSHPVKDEYIKWNDIEEFSEIKINSVKIIIIKLNNPEYYINNETNKFRKKLMEFNFSNYGSPFNITVGTMNIGHKDLIKMLNQNLKRQKYIA